MKPVRDKISFRRDGSTVRYSKRVERKSYGMLQLSRRLARGFGEKDAQAWEDELNGRAVATPSFPPLANTFETEGMQRLARTGVIF